jgi:integrase
MATPRSSEQKPKVEKRLHLRPDEAQRLIEAAGKRGRYPFRDRVLVRMTYRHGLRAAEAVGLRWDQIDLDAGILYVRAEATQGRRKQSVPVRNRTWRTAQCRRAAIHCPGGWQAGQARRRGASPHVATRGWLLSDQRRRRCQARTGLPGAQEHFHDGTLHRAIAKAAKRTGAVTDREGAASDGPFLGQNKFMAGYVFLSGRGPAAVWEAVRMDACAAGLRCPSGFGGRLWRYLR